MATKKKVVAPPKKTTPAAPTTVAPAAAPQDPNAPVKLVCKMHYAWGTDIIVGMKDGPTGPVPNVFTIDKEDGHLLVDKRIAATLLQNTEKYALYSVISKTPGKRLTFAEANPGVPNAIIRDPRTGRLLDDDEALRVLAPPDMKTGEAGMTGKMAGEASDPIAAQAKRQQAQPRPSNVVNVPVLANDVDNIDRETQIREENRKIQQEQLEAAATATEPSPAVGAEPPPSSEWPEVTMDMSKADMVGLLDRLQKAGVEVKPFTERASKADLLDRIETGYEKLAE